MCDAQEVADDADVAKPHGGHSVYPWVPCRHPGLFGITRGRPARGAISALGGIRWPGPPFWTSFTMNCMELKPFSDVSAVDFLPVVNDQTVRTHLIDHPPFDVASVRAWMDDKMRIDRLPGCRVRAVVIDGELVGWCGIQPDDEGVEMAVVIAKAGWGAGIAIFKEMMEWARQMGHREVMFHLLSTRPEYRALARRSTKVKRTTLSGNDFTTYCLSVEKWFAG